MKRKLLFTLIPAFFGASAAFGQIPQDNILAMFPFNGDATDISPYAIEATSTSVTGSADRFGNESGALAFNGSTSRVQVSTVDYGSILPLNDFTIAMWVRHDVQSQTPYPVLISKEYQNMCASGQAYNSFAVFTSIGQGGVNVPQGVVNTDMLCNMGIVNPIANGEGAASFDNGSWTHICYVKSAINHSIYINGVAVSTGNFQMGSGTPMYNSLYEFVNIGGASGNDNTWLGDIDDLIIYGRSLNANEVSALYNADAFGSSACNLSVSASTPLCGEQPTEVIVSGSNSSTYDVDYNFSAYSGAQIWYGTMNATSPNFTLSFGDFGNYEITVTDENGCTATYADETNYPLPLPSAYLTVGAACSGGLGMVNASLSPQSPAILELSNGLSSGNYTSDYNFTQLPIGDYSLELTGINGCTSIQNFTIEASSGPEIDYGMAGNFIWINIPMEESYTVEWFTFGGLVQTGDSFDMTVLTPGTQFWTVVTNNATSCSTQSDYFIYAPGENQCAFNSLGLTPGVDASAFDACEGTMTLGFAGNGPFQVSYTLNGQTVTEETSNLYYTFEGLCNGSYTFTVVDANDCSISSPYITTSVGEIIDQDWTIYPNPANEVVFIEGLVSNEMIKLYSPDARLVVSQRVMSTKVQLDIKCLAPGLYSLVIETPAGVGITKVLKH